MNKVFITGNITKDANITKTNNMEIAKYTLAVQRTTKSKEGNYDTDFLNCVSFNPNKYIKDNLIKGTKLLVEGRIQTSSFDDKNGNKHYSTDIIVERIEILKKSENKPQEAKENPYEVFGQQFEIGQQVEIDEESEYPF